MIDCVCALGAIVSGYGFCLRDVSYTFYGLHDVLHLRKGLVNEGGENAKGVSDWHKRTTGASR